jgi:predicted small secreted protein
MVRKTSLVCSAVLAIGLLLAGCNGAQKEATGAAINAAQSAINAASAEAAKYAPEQLAAAQATLQNAKDALAKGDYPAALSAAQDAANKAKDLAAAAAAKKDEWTKTWTEMSASMPKSLNEVKAKLDAYSHGAHMPAGMDKSKLADAKAQFEQLKQSWADASAAATQGDLKGAMDKMPAVKELLAKLKEALGIKS